MTFSVFWIIGSFQKRSILPHGGNFCPPEGEGIIIIVNVLGHPKGC
jgi:hypothetical protein